MTTFYEQEKELLETFIDSTFYRYNNSIFKKSDICDMLEMIVTPECNQTCDYCYIYKYKDKLYPKEIRADHAKTVSNMKALLNYYAYEKRYVFPILEIFAGDIYGQNLLFDTLDACYDYFKYIHKHCIEHEIFRVIIPNSLWFIPKDEEVIKKIKEYNQKFKAINAMISFSWSHDGKYSIDQREKRDISDEDYDKIFKFLKENNGGIHPMMCAAGVKNAIKNHEWWKEMCIKYDFPRPRPMIVRNPYEWTDESIDDYIKYMEYVLREIEDFFQGDFVSMARYIFQERPQADNFEASFIDTVPPECKGRVACSMQSSLVIRISDLAITICHRTCYDGLLGGKYLLNDDGTKIVDIEALNVGQYIDAKTFRADLAVGCANCWNRHSCFHGCIGAQREYSGDLYVPILSVCKLQQIITDFMMDYYVNTGLLDIAIDNGFIQGDSPYHYLKERTLKRHERIRQNSNCNCRRN